ncbi:MAG: radical SAM protein [Nitrospirae bacterium]|jgi:putative pyruvate formate lyase activating enzyme|nr:radical SAM protein [Nitrospirota bacterium]
MEIISRRQFIKSSFYLAVSGLWPAFFLNIGCKKSQTIKVKETEANIDPNFEPAYLRLHISGELRKRGEELWNIMESCSLCPRQCGVNRLAGDRGFCRASSQLEISAYQPHYGEEKSLVGRGGSGAIFFTNCGLRCVFCINWEVSQGGVGEPIEIEYLAEMMLKLQKMGCHNINLVTPTHYSPHIVLAIDIAAGSGLRLPLVYNTCGWERLDILKRLEGIVDIYLPDFKYSDGKMAAKYSSDADTYPEITRAALLEMHRQVGVAKPARDGLMYRGLMIRHLVMPNRVSGTKEVIEWIAKNLPEDTYLNIMSQYRPMYKAFEYPEISRRVSRQEYNEAVRWAKEAGLTNLDIQGYFPF